MTKFWSSSASLVDISKGGHVVIDNIDVSRWNDQNLAVALFNLRGTTHSYGVTNFTVKKGRIEDFSSQGLVLFSQWDNGNISISDFDHSSQAMNHRPGGSSPYGTKWKFQFNGEGPIVHISDSHLVGDLEFITSWGTTHYSHHVLIENTTWIDRKRPSDVIKFTAADPGFSALPVEFRNCRASSWMDTATVGFAVWDAMVGWHRGGIFTRAKKQEYVIADGWGGINASSDPLLVHLPTPAMLTELEVIAPQGGTAGTTTVTTSGGAVVASVTSNTSAKTFGGKLANPSYLSTDADTSVTVATTMAGTPSQTRVFLRGYW